MAKLIRSSMTRPFCKPSLTTFQIGKRLYKIGTTMIWLRQTNARRNFWRLSNEKDNISLRSLRSLRLWKEKMKRLIKWFRRYWSSRPAESVYGDDFGDDFGFRSAEWERKWNGLHWLFSIVYWLYALRRLVSVRLTTMKRLILSKSRTVRKLLLRLSRK